MSFRSTERGVVRYLSLSPWRRAPLRMFSPLSLFAGIAVAAFVLGLAAGSRPAFVASAASGALLQDLEDGCRFAVGLKVERQVRVSGGSTSSNSPPDLAAADIALGSAVGAADELDRVMTLVGPQARVRVGGPDGASYAVRPIARTDALDHIAVLTRGESTGIWLPDTVADALGARVDDVVHIDVGGTPVPTPVAGTFEDLSRASDASWCSMNVYLHEAERRPTPPVVLFDEATLLDRLSAAGVERVVARWEYAPRARGWTLARAEPTVASLTAVALASNNLAHPLGRVLGRGQAVVDSLASVSHARRTAATVGAAAGPVALATSGVAMLVLLNAARSWLDRRRTELTVLGLRGAGPGWLAVKAMLEMVTPTVIGAVAGMGAGWLLVRIVGPSDVLEASAMRSGSVQVAIALAVAILATGAVVAGAVRRLSYDVRSVAPRQSLLWWEPAVLALGAASLYELRTRGSSVVGAQDVDSFALLFPFMLLAGGSGLLARSLFNVRVLSAVATRAPTAGWLAARRLSARRFRAIPVVCSAAVAVGIVVFAGSMSSSIRATATAKALLGPGSQQIVRMASSDTVPSGVGEDGRSTVVTRVAERGVLVRGHATADVLGVSPESFADAAFWDSSFADRSLGELLALLDDPEHEGPVDAIAVGSGLPDSFVVTLPANDAEVEMEVRSVARAEAFPGLGFRQDRPLVVVHRDALTARGVLEPVEIWISDLTSSVVDQIVDAGGHPVFVVKAADSATDPGVRAQLWAIDYLELIGLAAAVVTVAGLALYFAANAARLRLASAVGQRLGMTRGTSVLATGLEVSTMLAVGWLLGIGLAWLAARLVFTYLDPMPRSAPDPLFRFDGAAVALSGIATVVFALIVTFSVEWSARRTSLPRMLRHVV